MYSITTAIHNSSEKWILNLTNLNFNFRVDFKFTNSSFKCFRSLTRFDETQNKGQKVLQNKAEVENNSDPSKGICASQHICENTNKLTCRKWPVLPSNKVRTKESLSSLERKCPVTVTQTDCNKKLKPFCEA